MSNDARTPPLDLQNNPITPADLPAPNTKRWTPNQKYIVVCAVEEGLLELNDALTRYSMHIEEFMNLKKGLAKDGTSSLKVRNTQKRRNKRSDRIWI